MFRRHFAQKLPVISVGIVFVQGARFSLDAWANRIALSCEDVDLVLANTMMQLGRAADLSLVLPGIIGLFRNPSTQSIPELWKQHMDCRMLDSAEGTLEVLEASHQEQRGVRGSSTGQRLGDRLFSIPGVWPQRACAHFIELSRNKDPFELFEAVAAFDRTWRDRNSVRRGTVMGTEWILVTPDGGRFGAVTYTGQSSLTMLQAYSHEQSVRHAYVSNFSNLVADDGSVYDVADCQLFTAEPL